MAKDKGKDSQQSGSKDDRINPPQGKSKTLRTTRQDTQQRSGDRKDGM